MDVTALCSTLSVTVWLLAAQPLLSLGGQEHEVFLHIAPDRLQFFEYESISFSCQGNGSAAWTPMGEVLLTESPRWTPSAGSSVSIEPAMSSDSGAYWCEDGDGRRSRAVNISVTAGDVILESPALPVEEGGRVTLTCKKKKSAAADIAEFFKDGLSIGNSFKGIMTIANATSSDEGLYKCLIPGAGESAGSRLAVGEPDEDENPPPHSQHHPWAAVLWTVALLLGAHCCTQRRAASTEPKPRPPEDRAVYSSIEYHVGSVSPWKSDKHPADEKRKSSCRTE